MKLRAFGIAVVLALPLTGCALITSSVCVDWIGPLSPADAGSAATVVLVGTVVGSADERVQFGELAPVHRVAVETVLKGELESNEIEVAAVPQTCNGTAGAFPDGDPLDTDERVELFLVDEDGGYRLLTPWDGVVAAPEGEPLPWEAAGDD